jgi:hypothetical protein
MPTRELHVRWLFCGVSCALVALPFLVVTYPLAPDLAQHVAQVRLFFDVLGRHQDAYRIHLGSLLAYHYEHRIFFAERWVPLAFILAVLREGCWRLYRIVHEPQVAAAPDEGRTDGP